MREPLLQISYSLATIENELDHFWQLAHRYRIWAFNGVMGAGKTTFIHALCNYLQVEDAVSSPTFALINEYHFPMNNIDKVIYHMDWYRLRNTEEAINAGMEDALNQKDAYCFVEWAEKAVDLLPRPFLWVDIDVLSETERKMTVSLDH